MKEKMTRIELGGVLGRTFGKVHHRLIGKTSEAAYSLGKTIKGFEQYLNTSKQRGLTYAVFRGSANIGKDELEYPASGEVIKIMPVVIGSKKNGMFQTIFGAVLIAVGAVLNFTPFAAASPFLYAMGGAMMLGGVIQMLSPQPAGLAKSQDSDNTPSYAFGGVTNTTAQGLPVPVLYGRRRIGGAIISAGIYVEDQQ